jgi:ketosteroid isomerase-like protein
MSQRRASNPFVSALRMATHFAPLVVAVQLAALPAPLQAREPRAAIVAVLAAVQQAGLKRDGAALDRLYSRDYFHTNPDGSTMNRAEVLSSYRGQPAMTFSAADTSELAVLSHGDFAVVSERVALHGKTREGDPFISTYRITFVLERRGAGWRVLNSHASLLGIDKHPAGSRQ